MGGFLGSPEHPGELEGACGELGWAGEPKVPWGLWGTRGEPRAAGGA